MKGILASVTAGLLLATAVLLGGCQAGSDLPEPTGVARETTETSVFYSTGRTLLEERTVIDAKDPYAQVVAVLMKAQPQTDKNIAIVQPQAKVNSVTFKDGIVTVDWSPAVLGFNAEPKEKVLAWAAFLRTFGEFSEVQKVRFTVDGKTSGKADGHDIQTFWGRISLIGEPWPVLRQQASKEASPTNP